MPSTADTKHPGHRTDRVHRRRTRALPALLLAALALVPAAVLAGPAAAAPAGRAAGGAATQEGATSAARTPSATAPHCVLAAGAGQTARCFATFPAAIAAATGGRVTDAPASYATAADDPAFAAELQEAVTAGSVLVGIEYANLNFGGATLSMTASGNCDASLDADYRFPSLPSGWNDRISSFRSYSNCAQQLFRNTSFTGGALTNVVTVMSYVGAAANDQASSLTFN